VLRRGHWAPAASERRQPDVLDARGRQPLLHRLASELRMPAAPRVGPDVDDELDAGLPDEGGEGVGGKGPMADGVHRRHTQITATVWT
jgi:hypothetical protein